MKFAENSTSVTKKYHKTNTILVNLHKLDKLLYAPVVNPLGKQL